MESLSTEATTALIVSIAALLGSIAGWIKFATTTKARRAENETKEREQELERDRKDGELRETLSNALAKVLDDTKRDMEQLRSKLEENEYRHKQEIASREQVIRNLESTIIERLNAEDKDRRSRDAKLEQEREYYRKTINDMREDTRQMMKIASDAQRQYDQKEHEKEAMAEDNRTLHMTVTGQREQIIQLTTQLDSLKRERDELQKSLEQAQMSLHLEKDEKAELRLEIERLKALIAEKDREITRLNKEIQELKRAGMNPALFLTAPDVAIVPPSEGGAA